MPTTVVRIYDKLSVAEQARDQLLSSGFAADRVHLSSNLDEAGPVENNFILDEKDTGEGPPGSAMDRLFGNEERTDAYGNATPVWRSNYLLTVDTDDDEQLERASDIMERIGAAAAGERAAQRPASH
ncbi:MAG TPA: hypothetical protein VGE12_22870 [Noviherbaspirillum sp.]